MSVLAKAYARFDAWYMKMPKRVQYPIAALILVAVLTLVGVFLGLLEKLDELPWWAEWSIIASMALLFLTVVDQMTERSERRKAQGAKTETAEVMRVNPQAETLTVTKKLTEVLQNNAQALTIAAGLIIAGFLWGGVYTTRSGPRGLAVFRVNRFTGSVVVCFINQPCKKEELAPAALIDDAGILGAPPQNTPLKLTDDAGILTPKKPALIDDAGILAKPASSNAPPPAHDFLEGAVPVTSPTPSAPDPIDWSKAKVIAAPTSKPGISPDKATGVPDATNTP